MPILNGRDSSEKLIEQLREVLEAPNEPGPDGRLDMLTKFTFGFAASIIKQLRDLRARLPWRPWMVNVFGGVTLLTIIGAAAWLVNLRSGLGHTQKMASENCDNIKANEERLRITENGIVRLTADMENLLHSRGVARSGPRDWARARQRLGISPDSISKLAHDSSP